MSDGRRIDFASADAAAFNALRDRWREVAMGAKVTKAAHRVAALLPSYVNRERGYAWPTDLELAELLNTSIKTISRGMNELDRGGLIERQTRVKRDEKGEAIGKERRIYLTSPEVNGQPGDVNGHDESEGTKGLGEWTDAVSIYLTDTLGTKNVGSTRARESVPSPYTGDVAFIDAFDRTLVAQTGGKLGGDVEATVQRAFDAATDSDDAFMPFAWSSVRRLTSNAAAEWFVQRTRTMLREQAA